MRTVDITTTQNVTIQYELAGVRERSIAFAIDIFLLLVVSSILLLGSLAFFSEGWQLLFNYFVLLPIAIFYTFLCEQLFDGQTLGKRLLGLKVVKLTGKPLTTADYFLRWTMRIIDIWFSLGIAAVSLVGGSTQSQRFGDLAANTAVIKLKSTLSFSLRDILKISSLNDYSPQYPSVILLKEQDIILIKNTLIRADRYRNEAHETALKELTVRVCEVLAIPTPTVYKQRAFLQTILKDYIVLTR